MENKKRNFSVILFVLILLVIGALTALILSDYGEKFTFTKKVKNVVEKTVKDEPEQKVKLDFYVMSQCPYGTQVEDAIAPVMQKMGDIVDLNIDYILYPKENYAGQEAQYCVDGLCSMHGIPEVKGNLVQLCVNSIKPEKSLDFIVCQNKTADKIPDNWEACADELKLKKNKIQACLDGAEGKKLLTESSARADAVQAKGSPTIYLNEKTYQGGRSEIDFQKAICQTINNEHAECANIPACVVDVDCIAEADKIGKCVNSGTKDAKCEYSEAKPLDVTILNDTRCQKMECQESNIEAILGQMKQAFKGIREVKKLDYTTEEGKALYANNSLETLPAFLFGKDVETAHFYNDIKGYLVKRGDYYELVVSSTYNPTKEICDNKVDDTDNGKIDCDDSDCAGDLQCRAELKGKLDLFVMSQCPYGTKALDVMPAVLEAFKGELNFQISYIANETEPGKFDSLHGQPEVDENIRELCAIKNYSNNFQYMDYIVCRNKNITDTAWEGCATEAKMDVSTIKTCSEGAEGIALHSANIKLSKELLIGASPTWMVNNKYQFSGLDAITVQKEICKYNPELKGCAVNLAGAVSTGATVPAGSCN